jgi:hypothetical protein
VRAGRQPDWPLFGVLHTLSEPRGTAPLLMLMLDLSFLTESCCCVVYQYSSVLAWNWNTYIAIHSERFGARRPFCALQRWGAMSE